MGILNFNSNVDLFDDVNRYDDFRSLEELHTSNGSEHEYVVKGVYTYVSKYGESCFIKSDGFNIQLPTHLVDTVKGIRNDEESVTQINDGRVYIKIYSYSLPDRYPDKIFYSIKFILK